MYGRNGVMMLSFAWWGTRLIWVTTRANQHRRGRRACKKGWVAFHVVQCNAGYNIKSLFRKLATSLPGSADGGNAGANGVGAAGAPGAQGGSNLIDIKLSRAPENLDEAKGCGC